MLCMAPKKVRRIIWGSLFCIRSSDLLIWCHHGKVCCKTCSECLKGFWLASLSCWGSKLSLISLSRCLAFSSFNVFVVLASQMGAGIFPALVKGIFPALQKSAGECSRLGRQRGRAAGHQKRDYWRFVCDFDVVCLALPRASKLSR